MYQLSDRVSDTVIPFISEMTYLSFTFYSYTLLSWIMRRVKSHVLELTLTVFLQHLLTSKELNQVICLQCIQKLLLILETSANKVVIDTIERLITEEAKKSQKFTYELDMHLNSLRNNTSIPFDINSYSFETQDIVVHMAIDILQRIWSPKLLVDAYVGTLGEIPCNFCELLSFVDSYVLEKLPRVSQLELLL